MHVLSHYDSHVDTIVYCGSATVGKLDLRVGNCDLVRKREWVYQFKCASNCFIENFKLVKLNLDASRKHLENKMHIQE